MLDEEESDGDINIVGLGRSSGFGVDGDTHMFGPGKSSAFGHVDGDMNVVGLGRSSGLCTLVKKQTCWDFTIRQFQRTEFQQSCNYSVSR